MYNLVDVYITPTASNNNDGRCRSSTDRLGMISFDYIFLLAYETRCVVLL